MPVEVRAQILKQLKAMSFEDGKATASGMAESVKVNEQIELEKLPEVKRQVIELLRNHAELQYLTMPKLVSNLLISRYRKGMAYGTHTDSAVLAQGGRSDLSFTLMLSEDGDYTGGELCMETVFGEQSIRIPAGAMLVYPTGGLHRVAEVMSGERIVIIGWIQSRVREASKRQILFDLDRAQKSYLDKVGHDRAADLLLKSTANLRRMWDEG